MFVMSSYAWRRTDNDYNFYFLDISLFLIWPLSIRSSDERFFGPSLFCNISLHSDGKRASNTSTDHSRIISRYESSQCNGECEINPSVTRS